MTTLAEHNHPPMVTCPEGCPAGPADLNTLAVEQMQIVATDTDTPPAADTVSVDPWSGHSHPENENCPTDCPKVKESQPTPDKKPPRKRAAKKAAAAPPNDGAEADDPAATGQDTIAEAVAQMTSKPPAKKARRSGKSAAQEEAAKNVDELTSPPEEAVVDVEREEWFRSPGFQRMKTAWEGEDKRQMDRVQFAIDQAVLETFPEAYAVMSDLYDLVREPLTDERGEVQTDPLGHTLWARNPLTGAYIEDWTLLGVREREDFLFRITTSLFEWEQRSATLWTRAMFSKGMFVEKFSIEYDKPISGTIDDRNARGNVEAAEDRYFALMNSAVSRKAEALVRSMTNLMLRLKDTLGQ